MQEILDSRDPVDNMTHPYEKRPKGQHLIWISGQPLAGKTTTSHMIAKKKDFVSYEGDFFIGHFNPYMDLKTENALDVFFGKKPLKGISKERFQVCKEAWGPTSFKKVATGENCTEGKNLYRLMCNEIKTEREKIGGNWIVNQAVSIKEYRDVAREVLGPDLKFVILTLDESEKEKRIKKRHGSVNDGVMNYLKELQSLYKPSEPEELNTFNILITEEMTPEDVAAAILEKCQID